MEGQDDLKDVLQAAAWSNHVNGDRREFTVKDVQNIFLSSPEKIMPGFLRSGLLKVGKRKQIPQLLGMDGSEVPLVKVLDVTTGLLQFSHLSFQEAFVAIEALRRLKGRVLELDKFLFSRKPGNMLRLCEGGEFPFPAKVGVEKFFSTEFTPRIFLDNLDAFGVPACTISSTLVELDLKAAGVTGEKAKESTKTMFGHASCAPFTQARFQRQLGGAKRSKRWIYHRTASAVRLLL